MNQQEYEKLKRTFEGISQLSKDPNLSKEEREKLQTLSSHLAGALMSSWLPADSIRKFFMFLTLLLSLYFFKHSEYISMVISLIVLCLFSPRIVGELAIMIGFMRMPK